MEMKQVLTRFPERTVVALDAVAKNLADRGAPTNRSALIRTAVSRYLVDFYRHPSTEDVIAATIADAAGQGGQS